MLPAIEIFDTVQTIVVSALLIVTIPIASFVYFKLFFIKPFSENYTFKLIAVNGITALLNSLFYLIFVQLLSFTFMFEFFKMIERHGLETTITVIYVFFAGLSLHSALFVALNRLKTLMSQPLIISFYEDARTRSRFFVAFNGLKRAIVQGMKKKDPAYFYISVSLSIFLSLPAVLDLLLFSQIHYCEGNFGNGPILIPETNESTEVFQTLANVIAAIISVATFAVNIVLAVLIAKARQMEMDDRSAERGLIITSVVSYVFYMLYFVNNAIARYFHVEFCGNAQFIFQGIACLTPFWCLIIFAPNIRRSVFSFRVKNALIGAQSNAISSELSSRR